MVLLVLLLMALFINWVTYPTMEPDQPVTEVSAFQATVCIYANWAAEILVFVGIAGLVAWLIFGSRRDHETHKR